eukprot:m.131403 g.131403  ORF g.131403 m.131403 type:complete len:59 (+) comp20017_c1_seq13:45-221(+)
MMAITVFFAIMLSIILHSLKCPSAFSAATTAAFADAPTAAVSSPPTNTSIQQHASTRS